MYGQQRSALVQHIKCFRCLPVRWELDGWRPMDSYILVLLI